MVVTVSSIICVIFLFTRHLDNPLKSAVTKKMSRSKHIFTVSTSGFYLRDCVCLHIWAQMVHLEELWLWWVAIHSVNVFHMGLHQHGVGVKLPSKCHHFQFYFHPPGATMLQLVLGTSSIHSFAYYKVKGVELLQCRGTIYLLGHFFPINFNISDVFLAFKSLTNAKQWAVTHMCLLCVYFHL